MATFIKDLAEQAMAEDLAYLGKQDPAFTLCPLGVINAYSKDNLATPQVQIDLRQHLAAAWPVLLDQLREQGIPIPQQLQTPHFFGASETACVTTTRKALEVSAWMVDLGSLEWSRNDGTHFKSSSLSRLRKEGVNIVSAKYPTKSVGGWSVFTTYSEVGVYQKPSEKEDIGIIPEQSYDTAAELKAAMQGQYLIYQLADPIRIQYSDLGLPDINSGMIGITTDHILTLSDTDGLEMHRLEPVEWTDEEGNTHPALITRYSRAYMDKHHAWPPALPMTYTGLQFTADYKEMRWLHDTVLKLINKYPV